MNHNHAMLITFAGAIFFGVFFILLANRLKISAIVLLLIGGIGLGPLGLGLIKPDSLGDGLRIIISLAVGLILFEGGLSLDLKGYLNSSKEIKSILSKGVLITWGGSGLIVKYIFGFSWEFSILSASLIIVTGPTVIGPLLKRIHIKKKLHSILHWEGVLIDPIGVFIALFSYEWLRGGAGEALPVFIERLLVGGIIGSSFGFLLASIIKKKFVPLESLNIFTVASAIAIFTISDLAVVESGLLSVTITGFVMGCMNIPQISGIRVYKAELIDMLIGLLFILLAAKLDILSFTRYGLKIVLAVLGIMVLVRPANIFISTIGSRLTIREKFFLSWIAPRGIVAASMASLFSISLRGNHQDAIFLETFTYSVIAGTVVFQGFTAGWVGRILEVLEETPSGWLIIGAHKMARKTASFIEKLGFSATLIDTNLRSIKLAKRDGLVALCKDIMNVDIESTPDLYGIGQILAITENEDLNILACQRLKKLYPKANLYRWNGDGRKDNDSEIVVGLPVWQVIKHQDIRELEVKDISKNLIIGEHFFHDISHKERVLLSFNKVDGITPFLSGSDHEKCLCLIYHPLKIRLNISLKPEWIIYSRAASFEEVVNHCLGQLERDNPGLDIADVRSLFLKQEAEYSSYVGFNIAIPHAFSDRIKQSLVLIIKLENPIKCRHTGELINLLFFVLSPKDKPRKHLLALSEISKFVMVEENHQNLTTARNRQDLVNIFFPSE